MLFHGILGYAHPDRDFALREFVDLAKREHLAAFWRQSGDLLRDTREFLSPRSDGLGAGRVAGNF